MISSGMNKKANRSLHQCKWWSNSYDVPNYWNSSSDFLLFYNKVFLHKNFGYWFLQEIIRPTIRKIELYWRFYIYFWSFCCNFCFCNSSVAFFKSSWVKLALVVRMAGSGTGFRRRRFLRLSCLSSSEIIELTSERCCRFSRFIWRFLQSETSEMVTLVWGTSFDLYEKLIFYRFLLKH